MSLFRLAYAGVGIRAGRVSRFVRAREKLGRFRIGVALDGNFAGRVRYRAALSWRLRLKEMAAEQRADVFRRRMRLDPGADGVVKLAALSEGHRIVDHVP